MFNREDMMMGGPGLNGYVYQADVYCVECGREIITRLVDLQAQIDDMDAQDSDQYPQPIFFGEADTSQYCADCGEYLYGTDE